MNALDRDPAGFRSPYPDPALTGPYVGLPPLRRCSRCDRETVQQSLCILCQADDIGKHRAEEAATRGPSRGYERAKYRNMTSSRGA